MSAPLFPLGQVVITARAREAAPHARLIAALASHARGDWGCLDRMSAGVSDDAVHAGTIILSAHAIDLALPCTAFGENCLLVATKGDRSATTILLPEEW
jgi:hypothetical protein